MKFIRISHLPLFFLFIVPYSNAQNCTTNYGINLGKVTAWKTEWQFVNIAHNSLGWFPPNPVPDFNDRIDESLLTADKYLPAGQSGLLAVVWDAPERFSENFVLTYSGNADVSIYLDQNHDITVTLDQPGRIEFSLNNEKSFFVKVTANTSTQFISDLRITKASQEFLTQVYDPVYLQDLANYKVIRFLDFGKINDSQVKEISDYPTSSAILQNEVSLENMITLANTLGADPWFCIPMQASNNFVTQWAQTIKNTLNPNLNVRIELSNEVWNTGFSQAHEAVTLGQQSGVLGNTNNNDRPAYYGYRSAEIHKIFENVFSSGGPAPNLIKVVAWQAASTWHTENYVLPYYKLPYGANFIPDELSIAPYFGGRLGWDTLKLNGDTILIGQEVDLWNLNQLFEQMENGTEYGGAGSLEEALDWTASYMTLATNENLTLSLYEGGQHLAAANSLKQTTGLVYFFIDANNDPRMGDLYMTYLNSLKNLGVGAIALYNSESVYDHAGSWGLKNYIGQPNNETHKYLAYSNFIDNNPPPFNCNQCTEVGQVCDDNDPNTENDIYDSNCNCTGTTIENCTMGYGVNLGSIEAFQSEWEFVNIAHHSLAWFPPNQDPIWGNWLSESQLTDDNYLPAGQSGILSVIWGAPIPISGDFVVTYDGSSDLTIYPNNNITVNSIVQGRIEFTAINMTSLFLEVTANTTNQSVSDIRVTKQEFENLNQIFSPLFLNDNQHNSILRFSDYLHINNSQVSEISDYPPSNALFQNKVSLENIIELSNELNADPWINIPLLASDAFVTTWAQQIKNDLDSHLKVRVELSSEIWNPNNSQHEQSGALARQLGIHFSGLDWDDAPAYYGYRSAQIHDIFETVFNSGGSAPELIKVIAWEATNPSNLRGKVLPLYRSVCGLDCKPDEIAIAPYFGKSLGDPTHEANVQTWNNDDLIDHLLIGNLINGEGQIQHSLNHVDTYLNVIQQEEIASLSLYAGGQHLVGYEGVENNQTITDLFTSTNRYARMQEVYTTYLNGLQSRGVHAMCMYNSSSTYNKWGSWGLKEVIGQNELNTPKYLAYKNFIQSNHLPVNCETDCELNKTLDDQLIYSGIYEAQNLISSRNGIVITPGNVTFRGNTICLDQNFIVDQGATFLAEIAPCN